MESIRSLAGCGRGFFHSTSFRSRERYDRNGRTPYSHVPFLSVIIVITIEHRRASHSDWKKEEGKKMCGNSSLDRSAASSQHDSLDNVCIYSTDRHERTASTRKWKLAAKSYGFWRLSGFLTTPSANCLILKKKKNQKCLERSNERYALHI